MASNITFEQSTKETDSEMFDLNPDQHRRYLQLRIEIDCWFTCSWVAAMTDARSSPIVGGVSWALCCS